MTTEEFEKLFDDLGLSSSFDKLKFGGLLNDLKLTFRVPVTTSGGNPPGENEEFLEHILGQDWVDFVETRDDTDDGIDKDGFPEEGIFIYGEPAITYYRHYYFHKDKFEKLTGERLAEIAQRTISMITNTDQPCPHDKIIIIVAMIALTIASGGAAGVAGVSWVAWVSLVLSIGLMTESFGKKESEYAQYGLYALAIYGGTTAIMENIGKDGSLLLVMQGSMSIANTALSGIESYRANEFADDMKDLDREMSQAQEDLAAEFEQAFHFTYEESYDSIYREGHEQHPYKFIEDTYKKYRV